MIIKPPGMFLSHKNEKKLFTLCFLNVQERKKVLTILSVCVINWPRKWNKKIVDWDQYCEIKNWFSKRNLFSCDRQLVSSFSAQFSSICIKSLRHGCTFGNLPHPPFRDWNQTDHRPSYTHLPYQTFPIIVLELILYCSCSYLHYF